jgi:hypothetical protein
VYASHTIGGQCETNEENAKKVESLMMKVVKAKIFKLLDAGVIYPITDSKWVAPIHVVPKKTGITLVKK